MSFGQRFQTRLSALVSRPLFWIALVLTIASFPILRGLTAELPPPPDSYGHIPEFELTNQQGQPFGSANLRGRVWIANFIFTRCPTVCPVFTARMAALQNRIRNMLPLVHLVSFSVDPEWDTPERLDAYAKKHRASPRMWAFLTGSPEVVRRTVKDGMKIAMEDEGMVGDVPDIIHGTHFVLVDHRMQIRGYYDSDDPEAVDRMIRDVGSILNRAASPNAVSYLLDVAHSR